MTDPSTLFLSPPQIRPSWTINGLTLEFSLAPTQGSTTTVSENNNYAAQTFQSIQPGNATTGTVFASVVGQGQCATPLRLAVRGGTSCWTQTAPSEPIATGMPAVVGDSIFAITQSAAFLSTGLSTNANGHTLNGNATATATVGSIPTGNAAAAVTFVPSNAVFEQGLCQLQQLMAKGLLNGTASLANPITASNVTLANSNCSNSGFLVSALDTKKKEIAGIGQLISRQSPNIDRKKRQKSWKTCSSVVVSPQPVNDSNCTITGNITPTVANSSSSFTMYELSPSSNISPASNTSSIEGASMGVTNNLSVSVSDHSVLSPTTTIMSPNDQRPSVRPFRPIAVKRDSNGTPCQVAEITTSSLNNRNDHSSSSGGVLSKRENLQSPPVTIGVAVTSSQLAHLSTSTQPTSVATSAISATSASVMSNGGIPVGIAVARQRYGSNSSCKTQIQTQNNKETTPASTSTSSYSSVVPYHQTLIEPSVFTSSISNIGVVAGAAGCEDRNGTNVGGGLPPPIIAWPTHTTGLPSQQHHAAQQWHPYSGSLETQVQNMPSTSCGGYQLARDPVNGQIILIPANQIDSLQQRTAFLIPGGAQPPTTGYSSSFLIPQQQLPPSHSVFLDHLVTFVPSHINAKQKPVPSTILKLEDGPITGVMMPCDLTKSTSINPTSAATAIEQQLITNNSSFSLVQQFNSSNIQNTNLTLPHHFSSISSSGSLLIQQISGNSGPPPLINHVNNSLVIAESAATQSVINSQSQYPSSNTSYLINTQQIAAENSTIIDTAQSSPCLISANTHHSNFSHFPSVEGNVQPLKSSVVEVDSNRILPIKRSGTENKSSCSEEVCTTRSSSDDYTSDKNREEAVIKVDANSSVQDASNQTDSMISFQEEEDNDVDDDDDDEDENVLHITEDEEDEEDEVAVSTIKDEKPEIKICENEKTKNEDNPDFSGLHLLLSGIERTEYRRGSKDTTNINEKEIDSNEIKSIVKVKTNDSDKKIENPPPNGLEILCALADQRFLEENEVESEESSSSDSFVRRRPHKISRNLHYFKRDVEHQYRSLKSEQKTIRVFSSKYNPQRIRSLSPNEAEIKMSIELAEIKKKYRETKKELSRLTHRKYTSSSSTTRSPTPCSLEVQLPPNVESDSVKMCTPIKRRPGRPRKYSDNLEGIKIKSEIQLTPPKPIKRPKLKFESKSSLLVSEDESKVSKLNNGDLSPPVLEPMCTSPKAKSFKSDILSPPTLIPSKKMFLGSKGLRDKEHKQSSENKPLFRLSSLDDSSDEELNIIKPIQKFNSLPKSEMMDTNESIPLIPKRKVGRPRKYPKDEISTTVDSPVIKKPKLNIQSSIGGITITNKHKEKRKLALFGKIGEKQVPVTSSVVSTFAMLKSQRKSSDVSQDTDVECKPKITPKLKAEAKLKTWRQESPEICKDELDIDFAIKKKDISYFTSVDYTYDEDFRVTSSLLDTIGKNSLRVLISVGGLFRAGQLLAVRPPDLYGIKLDGERGQRTHIYTREEILKDVVLEVKGKHPLRNGTRVCAFWSSQYLSLYPGYVALYSSSDESEDKNYTSVEFDDGDSGRICMNDIRLLPKDFSINRRQDDLSHAEGNTKRKRRGSGMSFEEIPIDKQLHSPESPSLFRETINTNESGNRSPLTTSPSYDSSSRSSFNNDTTASKNELSNREEENLSKLDIGSKEKNGERKRLKKKRKDKFRENFDSSNKKRSHKHKSDSDEFNGKTHKRHKHKHKHHKHHKKRKSPSGRKYTTENADHECKEKTDHNSNVETLETNTDAMFDDRKSDHENYSSWNINSLNSDHSSNIQLATNFTNFDCDPIKKQQKCDLANCTSIAENAENEKSAKNDSNTTNKDESNSASIHEPNTVLSYLQYSIVDEQLPHLEVDKNVIISELNVNEKKPSKKHREKRKSVESDISGVHVSKRKCKNVTKEESVKSDTEILSKIENVETKDSGIGLNDTDDSVSSQKILQEESINKIEPSTVLSSPTEEDTEFKEMKIQNENVTDTVPANLNDKFWDWHGKGFKRNGKGRARKEFYKSIKRGDVVINVGECAVFLTANNAAKPFIGRIESMWESYSNMMVRVNWFYHPEETTGLEQELPFLGALFESPHNDKNDVQTISHKCDVVSIKEYRERTEREPDRLEKVYKSNDLYYLAGYYDPKTKRITFEEGVLS